MDASEYIKELKQKVVTLKQEMACEEEEEEAGALLKHSSSPSPTVTVETLAGAAGHGFVINVLSDKSCPGLLVSILEAFDELGLSLHQATASCADTFRLEAIGGEMQNQVDNVDEHVVKQAVLQAIRTCSSQGCRQQQE
ncbi:unnamed protein product [Miscanthus lutarioriparius]|uniref:Plant bHLH transcription factor ACT-like domain-containing protein n=1 Tax=Miscanthus lutarioriparius TaxID=422564 RepID=A0A811NGX4_9POAL|nr:unnamed protein product [Miscanthus lutarioriparius]